MMKIRQQARFTLVLGSGGVKSIAGLGVMEVLEREGLAPSAVVGCSAGAIFGALIAAGHRAHDAVKLATTLWSREITSTRRHRAMLEIALPRLAGFGDGFALRDDSLIRQRLHTAFGSTCIEQLPVPMQVQATDAHDGSGVLLSRGRLDEALRASIALPFLFTAQRIGARLLVDGSLSEPLPLSAADGSHITLALGFRVPYPRRCDSATRLATRVTAALSNNLLEARLATAQASRLVLMLPEPQRRIGLFDTEAMPELLALGRRAAEAALPRLMHLLDTHQPLAARA
jgi:NTE family protein